MKKIYYWIILIIFLCVFIEGTSLITLFFLNKVHNIRYNPADYLSDNQKRVIENFINSRTTYFRYSSELGWTIKEKGFSSLYRANSKGIRGDKEYELSPPHSLLRIASFGDSFTHCSDVKNNETWQEKLSKLCNLLEVMNFGVDAFGLDQAFLRYLNDGQQYQPDIVFIGFMSENIFRSVNVFRSFYNPKTNAPLAKPRFIIKNEELILLPNPIRQLSQYNELLQFSWYALPKLGKHDYFYQIRYKSGLFDFLSSVRLLKLSAYEIRKKYSGWILRNGYYNEKSEAFKVTNRIFTAFYEEVINNKSLPVIIIFPNKNDFGRYLKMIKPKYEPLISFLEKKKYKYIDLLKAFKYIGLNYTIDDVFVGGHYSSFANKLVAQYMLEYLRILKTELKTSEAKLDRVISEKICVD